MRPDFALTLSFDGIKLLRRAAGGWHLVGECELDVPDLPAALEDLKDRAERLAGGPMRCKLLIPDEQIRHLTIPAPADVAAIETALDGATPYPLSDLRYDYEEAGDAVHIAAVAEETLAEAEAFATTHGMNPVSFAAIPPAGGARGEIHFGKTAAAASLLAPWEDVARDAEPVRVIGVVPDADFDPPGEARDEDEGGADPTTGDDGPDETAETGPQDATDAPAEDLSPDATEDEPDPVEDDLPVAAADGEEADQGDTPVAETDGADAGEDVAPVPLFASRARPEGAGRPAPAAPQREAREGFRSRRERQPARRDPPVLTVRAPEGTTEGPRLRADEHPPEGPSDPVTTEAPDPVEGRIAPVTGHPDGALSEAILPPAPLAPVNQPEPVMPEDPPAPPPAVGGKPRYLGLVLTALLILFLAAVAAWASLSEGGLARFFDRAADDAPVVSAVAPTPLDAPQSDAGAIFAPSPETAPDLDAGQADLGIDAVAAAIGEALRAEDPVPEVEAALAPAEQGTVPAPLSDPPEVEAALDLADAATDLGEAIEPEEDAIVLEAMSERAEVPGAEAGSDAETEMADDLAEGQLPPGRILSPAEAEAAYERTGVWQRAPRLPLLPQGGELDDFYVASIDPPTTGADAIALPPLSSALTDDPLAPPAPPPAPGTVFAFDADGRVAATEDGVVTPSGVLLFAGSPPVTPPDRPGFVRIVAVQPGSAEPLLPGGRVPPGGVALTALETPQLRPRARPDNVTDAAERVQLGGLLRSELAAFRPRTRPDDLSPPVLPETDSAAIAAAVAEAAGSPLGFIDPTTLAVGDSLRPDTRPDNFARVVAVARQNSARVETRPLGQTIAPTGPVPGSVAQAATLEDAINLRRINLIGVYGRPDSRRALVRLSNGRYLRLTVGDRLDGGQVTAIGSSTLTYVKNGRSRQLEVPQG